MPPSLAPVTSRRAAPVAGTAKNVDDASIVFYVDILLFTIFLFVVVAKLPRGFALFKASTEWCSGHFLYYSPYKPSRRVLQARRSIYPPTSPVSPGGKEGTDDSHTLYSHTHQLQRITDKGHEIVMQYPPHVASILKQFRPLLAPLRARVSPGFSVGQLLILSVYFYALVYASFYRSNVFTDSARTGWVAIAQMPILYALAQKNNVLGWMLGYGYERMNYLHRFVGRVAVLAANIHALHYFYKWSLEGTFKDNIKLPPRIWAMVGLLCFDLIFFFSTQFWRNRAYNLFLSTHVLGFSLLLPACYYHKPSTLPWMFTCLAIYLFDRVFRILKTRVQTAILRPLPELDCTRIEVPSLSAGWRAGQHVRIRVLSPSGLGWRGCLESHPFTIASVANGPEGLVLLVKKSGTWTKRLFSMARKSSPLEDGGVGRRVKVTIEGPYGGPGHTIFSSFSSAVFVAGGSGISFAISAIQDIVRKDLEGRSRVKSIDLIWTMQDPQGLVPMLPMLTGLIQQSVFTPIRMSIYYTRAPIGKPPFRPDEKFIPGLTLSPGRPQIEKVIEVSIGRAVQLGAGIKDEEPITGLVVGVCGPVALADDVVAAVNAIDPVRRDQVGGIEIHEEAFGW